MTSSAFTNKKAKILATLSVPESEYTDSSPQGFIDHGIRSLIAEINTYNGLVTTSSCAGRVSVFLEGKKRVAKSKELGTEEGPTGKGGGKWLFVSHDPVEFARDAGLLEKFGLVKRKEGIEMTEGASLVHFKFEPMILHILTASLLEASKVLNAASQAGFRESGAVSITPAKDGSTCPMVGVRSAGLSFDCIIGFQAEDGSIVSLVDEGYLKVLIDLGNERFKTNSERIGRFQMHLKQLQEQNSKA